MCHVIYSNDLKCFDKLTIHNCEILRNSIKGWGMALFSASNKPNGIYTISNCTFNGVGTQGIYINESSSGTIYNILNCEFNGDFGHEGAITIQNNANAKCIINVKGCSFNNIPSTSHKVYLIYNNKDLILNHDLNDEDFFIEGR